MKILLLAAVLGAQSLIHVTVHATIGTVSRPVELGAFIRGQHADAVLTFDWDFGDGSTLTTDGPTIDHQYTKTGAYQVTVIVRDTTRPDQIATSEPIHAIVRQ